MDLDIFLELLTVFTECTQSLNYFSTLQKKSGQGDRGQREGNEIGESNWEERETKGKKRTEESFMCWERIVSEAVS